MKKLLFLVAFFATTLSYSFGQKTAPSQLLSLYFEVKDALVNGNANAASDKAGDFIKAISEADVNIVGEVNRAVLLKDIEAIAKTKDLKEQRVRFAPFSDNMIALAKTVRLSADPVYQQYCPMKKASWLSNQQAIKNPYYGSAMLTCGSVKATL